jgi:hypothetical protein
MAPRSAVRSTSRTITASPGWIAVFAIEVDLVARKMDAPNLPPFDNSKLGLKQSSSQFQLRICPRNFWFASYTLSLAKTGRPARHGLRQARQLSISFDIFSGDISGRGDSSFRNGSASKS